MINKRLAIAISSYNRSEILKENLVLMLGEIREFSIPIYISDDSTDDDTERFGFELKKEYEYIYYHKNKPRLGHDKNCITTLTLPSEDYVWYLGDSIIIKNGKIKKVLSIINAAEYDFLAVNAEGRNLDIKDSIYCEGNKLLVDLGWHLTMTGTTIYSKYVLADLKSLDLIKYRNFPQTSIIFEEFSKGDKKLFWLNDKIVYVNKLKKSYWRSNVFSVFLYDWDHAISNLPEYYSSENKLFAIKKHSDKTGLFTLLNFANYRAEGVFNLKVLTQYFKLIRKNSNANVFILFIIALTPQSLFKLLKKLYKLKQLNKSQVGKNVD